MGKKVLVICGPTATGKTSLAILLAKKLGGELVNADSRQVYREMDIITGKDLPVNSKFSAKGRSSIGRKTIGYREKNGIPIWLVDIVKPDYVFSVGEYQKLAHIAIQDIMKRGKLPIVVGGTGLYIKSIVEPIPLAQIPPNNSLRNKLYILTLSQLQTYLQNVDNSKWNAMNQSDRANPRRLVRAIEISDFIQSVKKSFSIQTKKEIYDSLIIGLTATREVLFSNIDKRIEERIKTGALSELQTLIRNGYSLQLPSMTATGFRELSEYIKGIATVEEATKKWGISEHSYAKRQMTWFKKVKGIEWFDITDSDYRDKIVRRVEKWYTRN